MRRKPTSRTSRPAASLPLAALAATLVSAAPTAAASGPGASVPPRSLPPRTAATCAHGIGAAVFAPHCSDRLRLLSATLPDAARPGSQGQLAAAPGSVTVAAEQLPAQGAALAGAGLVLLGIARHIRKSR